MRTHYRSHSAPPTQTQASEGDLLQHLQVGAPHPMPPLPASLSEVGEDTSFTSPPFSPPRSTLTIRFLDPTQAVDLGRCVWWVGSQSFASYCFLLTRSPSGSNPSAKKLEHSSWCVRTAWNSWRLQRQDAMAQRATQDPALTSLRAEKQLKPETDLGRQGWSASALRTRLPPR